MLDYIAADYLRILKRIPRLIQVGAYYLFILAFVVSHYLKAGTSWNSVGFVLSLNTPLALYTLFIGAFELLAVFSDDFKAKTMQVAIGMGIRRTQVIAAKLIELGLLMLTDLVALLLLLIFPLCLVTGVSLAGPQIASLAVTLLSEWMTVVGYGSLMLPLIFRTQSMIGAILVYLPLVSSLVYHLLRFCSVYGAEWFQKLSLESLTLDSSLSILSTHLLMGRLNFGALMGFVVYVAIGYIGAVLVFRNQELEF